MGLTHRLAFMPLNGMYLLFIIVIIIHLQMCIIRYKFKKPDLKNYEHKYFFLCKLFCTLGLMWNINLLKKSVVVIVLVLYF